MHAETSTGVENEIAPLAALQQTDTLLLVDTVTSLGGIPVDVDGWGIDAVYSGTQKCLGVPPGLSPLSFSARAVERVRGRAQPAQSWYLDLGAARRLRRAPRAAITTPRRSRCCTRCTRASASCSRKGSTPRTPGTATSGGLLQDALPELGFRPFALDRPLPQLTSVWLPDGVDDAKVRGELRVRFGIEVGGGLGELAGKGWRIGLMGHSARERSVITLLGALGTLL